MFLAGISRAAPAGVAGRARGAARGNAMEDRGEPERVRGEADARLAAIIESSDDAIVSKTLEGIVRTWNKGAERIFGWTAAEVIGKPITIIIPTDRLEEEPRILARMRAGERIDHFETVRQTKDGRLINVSVTISPIRDATGKIVGVSKVARDVTLQKRYQQDILAARDAAEQAKLLAEQAREAAETASRAKDHFLSVLSHELRTPLTPVLAAVSLMEQDATVPPHVAEQLSVIRRNVETEARLVDDLLDLTRIARGKVRLHFEVVDAHAVARNVVAMFQRDADEKGLTVAVSLRAKRFHVWADPGRFQQMLLNLMSNSVKFTPQDGTITVRTSNENGTIKIELADTGVGIEPDVMPRLFQPFEQGEQTVTRQFGGLGLGLSIVKALVEMHKASISAASEGNGRGATFTLRIDTVRPAHGSDQAPGGEAGAAGAAAGTGAGGRAQGYRVLLVEDHADTRNVMAKLLASFGCVVTTAASVREALDAAERQTFDLLLSDIGLPDGSGTDVMRHVGARFNLKGIALSGFGQDDDLRRSREAGFATHLTKPVNLQTLRDVIRSVVA
jgi:PAS domain S-box-containing protein